MLNNDIFIYEEETCQSVEVDGGNFAFHNGYFYEQETQIYGDHFFNSLLQEKLKEYDLDFYVNGLFVTFQNVLEEEDQDFEETPGYMVLKETKQKIAKFIEGFPMEELFQIKKTNELLFQNLIDYHYDC